MGGDHRDEAGAFQVADEGGVDLHDVAHLAHVDQVVGVFLVRQQQLLGPDHAAILAGEAHGLAAGAVDEIDHVLVHLAAQDHFHHFHGFGVGDAHALDEFALLADPAEHVLDLGAAAMDHHHVHAHQLQQHHVPGEALLEVLVGHGVAAVFDDDGAAVEALDVGQGFGQDGGLLGGGGGGHGVSRMKDPGILPAGGRKEKAGSGCRLSGERRRLSRW